MGNQTSTKVFHILAFSNNAEKQISLFVIFLLIYLTGIVANLIIIIAIYKDSNLHTPMYLFLCNLSFVDICYPSVTLPKLMDILVTGSNTINYIQCLTQMNFFILMGGAEIVLLSSMAYDRYNAICNPLYYHVLMGKTKCFLLLVGTWISACANAIFLTLFATKLVFCDSTNVQQFFCDVKALAKITCSDPGFQILIFIEALLYGLCPFLLSLMSYTKIIIIILRIKSADGRKKAFSTCTSHLTVLIMYYVTIMCMYIRPPSKHSELLDRIFSVLYSGVTPMLNPLIYSLRNKDVKSALLKIFSITAK